MIDTDHYLRFERAGAVRETEHGVEADLERGERLRVEVVAPDVVRLKITRGGAFDEAPTYAVCADPLAPADAVRRRARRRRRARPHDRARRLARDRPVPARRPPPRRVGRDRDGRGRRRAAVAVRDAERGLHRPPPLPARGRDLRAGGEDRPAQPPGARFHAVEHRRPRSVRDGRVHRRGPPGDPRGDRTSAEFDPYYVSIPFFSHHDAASGAAGGSFVDNGYRAAYDVLGGREVPHPLRRRPVHRVRLRRSRACPTSSRAYTCAHRPRGASRRCGRSAITSAAGTATRRTQVEELGRAPPRPRGSRATACGSISSTWTATACSPGTRGLPGRRRDARAAGRPRLPGRHDRRPGREARARLCGLRRGASRATSSAGPRAATSTSATCGRATPRSPTSRPRRGAHGGESATRAPAVGRRRDLERHERARDRRTSARARCASTAAASRTSAIHNQYALLMAMAHDRRPARGAAGAAHFVLSRAGFAGIQRYAAHWMGDNQARWDHLWMSVPMAMGLGRLRPAVRRAPTSAASSATPNAELAAALDAVRRADAVLPQPLDVGNVDQYAWSWGGAEHRPRARGDRAALPAAAVHLRRVPRARRETGEPVQRPLVFDHQDDPAVRDLDDEYLFGPTCSSRR